VTEQEIFDVVYLGLADQGFRPSISFNENVEGTKASCMYRGPDGLKCAAGHLIPDSAYTSDLEYTSASALMYFIDNFDESALNLIDTLQLAHDGAADCEYGLEHVDTFDITPEVLKSRLELVAKYCNLTVPQIPG
jgi:hypothetical protein